MNYVAELNAFNEWCERNYLPMQSQFLWYKLMSKNNRLGWCEWMLVDNLELMGILQIKREATAIAARDKLVDVGLVEYVRGKKGRPNMYRMVSLSNLKVQSEVYSVVQSEVYSVVQTEVQSVAQTADINKLKHKQNKTNPITTADVRPDVAAVVEKYENDIGTMCGSVYQSVSKWLDDGVDASLIEYAIDEACMGSTPEKDKRNWRYIEAVLNSHFEAGRRTRAEAEQASDTRKKATAERPQPYKNARPLHKNSFTDYEQSSEYDIDNFEERMYNELRNRDSKPKKTERSEP